MASTGDTWRLGRRPALDELVIGRPAMRRGLVAGAAGLLVLRGSARLAHPRLFAEDGTVFLADSRNHGLSAVVEPYAGYLHLVPRLVAAASTPAPLTWTPTIFTIAAVVGCLLMMAPVLSHRLAWLIPGATARAVAFLLLCLLPALTEAYGNIANLIFVGGITMFLLLLSTDPGRRLSRGGELVAISLLGLSGPLSMIFAPFFVWRWHRNGRSGHSAAVAGLLAVCAAVQTVALLASDRTTPGGGTSGLLLQALVERLAGVWLFGRVPVFAGPGAAVAVVVATLWLVAVVAVLLRSHRWAGVLACGLASLLVGSAVWAYGPIFAGDSAAAPRHLVTPLGALVVMLVAAGASPGRRDWTKLAASVCLGIGLVGMAADFVAPALGSGGDSIALRVCVEAQDPCTVRITPSGWVLRLTP